MPRSRTLRFSLDGIDFTVEIDRGSLPSMNHPGDPASYELIGATWKEKEIRLEHAERYTDGKHQKRFLDAMNEAEYESYLSEMDERS